jgi:transitional endoplasmic reticulum ATPase
MIEAYEQLIIAKYIQNLLKTKLSAHALKELCSFMETGLPFLGIKGSNEAFFDLIDDYQSAVRKNSGSRKLYKLVYAVLDKLLDKCIQKHAKAEPSPIENNIRSISKELGLDELEKDFFALIVRYRTHDKLESILNDMTREHMGILELCATCISCDRNKLAEKLRQKGRLLSSGVIVQSTRNGRDIDDHFDVPSTISTAMQRTLANLDDVRRYILGEPLQASLDWDDFDHLGKGRDKLSEFLGKIVDRQIPGVNILLWGPPGTGKTEFCKTLAAHLGLEIFALGEADDSGDEPDRKERASAFNLAQNLLRYQKNSLLLFDEMDDLFCGGGFAQLFGAKMSMGSKVFTNRLFENNPIPTLWTINDVSSLDESVIRRMALAIEVKVPTAKSRERVWKRLLDKHQIEIPEKELTELAQIEISPAVASNAVQFAGLVESSLEDVHFATQGIIKATKGRNRII